MSYESELRFLCDTFRKCHVRTCVASPDDPLSEIAVQSIEAALGRFPAANTSIREYLGELAPRTVYKSTDAFRLSSLYLLLPSSNRLLYIGPYVHEPLTPRQMLEAGEKNGISPKGQPALEAYYSGIPVINESSHLFAMLDAFCEHIWGDPAFAIVDVGRERSPSAAPISGTEEFDDLLLGMKTMEQRYAYENEMMQAVSLGQIHKANRLLTLFSEQNFERRMADPLRDMKNYCVIMNTLLRKAAENGGVHPIYLDRISSSFAVMIEQLASTGEATEAMGEMFRAYCRLVRKHSMKDYSPVVQKAIIHIDSDLSANLALSSLAEEQSVSPGYLSTVFKKETGRTVTEYIREKRISHATHLLSTTHLQVQTIALHCGIMDVQYFSKIFKKHTGKTPKEYRESMKLASFQQ